MTKYSNDQNKQRNRQILQLIAYLNSTVMDTLYKEEKSHSTCPKMLVHSNTKKVKASHTRYRTLGTELIRCTGSQPTGDYKSLLSACARPAVTFSDAQHHRPWASTKLYCLVAESHTFEQLAQGCYAAFVPIRT